MNYSPNYQASVAVPARGRILPGQTVNDTAYKGRRAVVSRNRVIFDQAVASSRTKPTTPDLMKRFGQLTAKWQSETMHLSSPHEIYLNDSHAQIIGMGPAAVPLILKALQTQPYDWFFALRAISGENPVPDEAAGDIRRMSDLWLAWGKRKGFVK